MAKRGPRKKTTELKLQELQELRTQEAHNLKLLETNRSSLNPNPNIQFELTNEVKSLQRKIKAKIKTISKKDLAEYDEHFYRQNELPITQNEQRQEQLHPDVVYELTEEREQAFRDFEAVQQNMEDGEIKNAETDEYVKRINLISFLLGEDDHYIAKSEYGNLVEPTPQQKAEIIRVGQAQQIKLQPMFDRRNQKYDDTPSTLGDDEYHSVIDDDERHSVIGEQHTPFKLNRPHQIDYIRTGKSTILVILKQIQSLIKQSEQYIKRIFTRHIVASESDLAMIGDEVTDMVELRSKFPLPIDEDNYHSPEIAAYLTKIIMQLLNPLIENLITYLKMNAQLNQKQLQGFEAPPSDDDQQYGAGRPQPQVNGRNLILSDTVRRIHNYDKKYLL